MHRLPAVITAALLAFACGKSGDDSSLGGGAVGSDWGAGGSATSYGAGGAGNGGTTGRGGAGNATGGSGTGGVNAPSGGAGSGGATGTSGARGSGGGTTTSGKAPVIAGCAILPDDHIFNTAIDRLPAHPSSDAFVNRIGSVKIHLDLGQSLDMSSPDSYWGIPYNVVHGNSATWTTVAYTSRDDLGWDPTNEADCATNPSHGVVSPCTAAAARAPVLPIPASPLVEGGIFPDVSGQIYGDHHVLLLDADTCRLWEGYHAYSGASGTWDIFGSATFDLKSDALRPAGWSSADAAGFPILPLLLRADEASSGTIHHALRFTIDSASIRTEYTWPARHLTNNGTGSAALPPMGQLFRLKSSTVIPTGYDVQSKAILQALKTYGMYLADGGSNLYIQGEPSANWSDKVFDEVQSVRSDQFEAVDLSSIESRAGFDKNSAAVPP